MKLRITPAQDEVINSFVEKKLYLTKSEFIIDAINEKIDREINKLTSTTKK